MGNYTTELIALWSFLQGIIIGWLIWAPMSPVKGAVLDGVLFKSLWKKK